MAKLHAWLRDTCSPELCKDPLDLSPVGRYIPESPPVVRLHRKVPAESPSHLKHASSFARKKVNYLSVSKPRTVPPPLQMRTSSIQWSHQHSLKLGNWCSRVYSMNSNVTEITVVSHQSRNIWNRTKMMKGRSLTRKSHMLLI